MTPVTSDQLLQRAHVGTRLMTVRGAIMRAISIGSNLMLIALLAPRELGLFAVARGVLLIFQMISDLGVPRALLRRPATPTAAEYGALAGIEGLAVAILLACGVIWPGLVLGFGAIDARWYGWMMLTLSTMVAFPFGTGARLRLQRSLAYEKIAICDVTNVLVLNVGLLLFALAGRFSVGVFVTLAVATLVTNVLTYFWAPGPMPIFRFGPIRSLARESSGYMVSSWLSSARDYGTPILLAKLFGLELAGVWAFAARISQLLNVAFEGFRNATIPAAVRLAHDRPSLKRLASSTLSGALIFAVPLAGIVFVSIPVLATIWPRWHAAIDLAQVYVLGYAVAGAGIASLEAVSTATRGAVAMLAEHASALVVAWIGFVIVWSMGSRSITWVTVPMNIAPLAALLLLTDADVRPTWNSEMTRVVLSLVTGLALYATCSAAGVPPLATAVVGCCGIVAWLRPGTRLRALSPDRGRVRRLWAQL